jgi:hypothetical protein
MMRGQAMRYLGWQVRDRAFPRLLASLLIVAAIFLPLHFASRHDPIRPDQIDRIMGQLHFQLLSLAVVIIFHGIVSEDRVRGYFRFYLAKPVSPLWFYGQSFALALLATLLFTVGFLAAFSLAITPAWHWQFLTSSAAMALVIGGLVFLFSTLSQRDWIWMIVVAVIASVTRSRFPAADSTLGRVLNAILPPNHLVDATSLSAGQWAWVAGWGVGLFLLGLLILKKRPLGED